MAESYSPMLERCRQGDGDGWAQVLRDYGALVQTVARRIGLSAEQCDDVCQETFISLFQNLSKLRTDGALCKWLVVAASRFAFRARKRSGREVVLDTLLDTPFDDFEEAVLDRIVDECRRAEVAEALESLQPDHRRLMRLLFFEGKDYVATADAMGLSVGSVGPIRAKSLRRLAGFMATENLGMELAENQEEAGSAAA